MAIKGVYFVILYILVLYAHNTIGTCSSQLSRVTLHTFLRALSNTLLNASIVPFVCGWYEVLVWWWIINYSISAKMVELMKWVPWSLIITFGHPNLDKTFSKWNFSYFPWFFKIILFYLCMRNSFFYSYIISFNSWWITS